MSGGGGMGRSGDDMRICATTIIELSPLGKSFSLFPALTNTTARTTGTRHCPASLILCTSTRMRY